MYQVPSSGSVRALVVLAALALAAASAALADADHRPGGLFDDRVRHREGGAFAAIPLPLSKLAPADPLRTAWEQFAESNGGGWSVYLEERSGMPALVAGRGIEWLPESARPGASLEQLETRARAFLAENRALFHGGPATMELDRRASFGARNGHWQIVFRQVVDDVRVEDARLELHVKRGRLVMLGASNWGRPTVRGIPTLDAEQARAALDDYIGGSSLVFEQAGEPELTIIVLDADPSSAEPRAWKGPRGEGLAHALVWRFRFRDPAGPATWVGEVDAHDGSVRAFYDATRYASVRGGVFPISADGDCATGGCEIAGFPMPYADYTESGQPEEYADEYGNLMCAVATAPFETNLSGPYINVADVCGQLSEFGTCDEGLDLGLKHGENCDVAPGDSAGNTAAARSAYYHLNRAAEVARFYDPDNPWLQSPLTVNVNIASTCNANWDGTEVNMYGAGGGCRNTAELQSILVHEWGHGYDHNDGGDMDRPGEAYADITFILAARDSCMSRGIYDDGRTCDGWGNPCLTCTGFRDFDWTLREWNTPATPTGWAQNNCPVDYTQWAGPCRRQPHCESYISSEAIYDLATRDLPAAGMDQQSAWQLVERLWYETRPGSGGDAYFCYIPLSHSCNATSWYQRMRVADDDDGDLSNGTPHAAALFAAFDRHDIACDSADDPENQSTSACPTLGAPVLSVVETPSGTQLDWSAVTGAAEYRVYRGELGCDRQQVPLASLTGGETTYLDAVADQELTRNYRVEAFGANPACFSPVSNCATTPPGARLQELSRRVADEDHDGDGIPEPGETIRIPITLFNIGSEGALSTAGTVSLVGPLQARLLEPHATWPDIPAGGAAESEAPHFELVLLEEAACGDLLTLDYEASAANGAAIGDRLEFPMGDRQRDFLNDADYGIPTLTTGSVQSPITVDQERTIAELDVSVNIQHEDPTQLVVELSSPGGTTVRLHDRSAGGAEGVVTRYDLLTAPDGPGSLDDFTGRSALGTWTLSIEDVDSDGPTNIGYLYGWTLHATVETGFDCEPSVCGEPAPVEAPHLRVNKLDTGSGIDLLFSWDPISAAGYHLLRSESASFDGVLELLGRTTTETTFTEPDEGGSPPPLVFYQVRGVNSCNQEGP
jgi:subtilisin-like proprotein convertase family protein